MAYIHPCNYVTAFAYRGSVSRSSILPTIVPSLSVRSVLINSYMVTLSILVTLASSKASVKTSSLRGKSLKSAQFEAFHIGTLLQEFIVDDVTFRIART